MFALVGQVERAFLGREAFQEIDQVATLGGLAKWAAEPRRAEEVPAVMADGRARGPRRTARTGPPVAAGGPARRGRRARRRPRRVAPAAGPRRRPRRSARSSSCSPRPERPVILAGGGVLRARTSTELMRFAELLHVPIIAAWRRGDVVSNDHPLYLGMAGLGAPASRPGRDSTSADAMLVIGCRLNEATSYGYTIPAAGTPLGPRRPRAEPGGRPAAGRPRRRRPTRARSCGPRTSGCWAAPSWTPNGSRPATANNAADRATWEAETVVDGDAVGRAGRPPGS